MQEGRAAEQLDAALRRDHEHPIDRQERDQARAGSRSRRAGWRRVRGRHQSGLLRPRRATMRDIEQPAHDDGEVERQQRHRGAVAVVGLGEDDAPDVEADIAGRGAGAAAGQHPDLVDDAQRIHQPDEDRGQDRRPQQRQRDVPEDLEAVGAVDLRLLERLLGQRGQGGQQRERDQRRPVPDIHDHGGGEGLVGVACRCRKSMPNHCRDSRAAARGRAR